MLLEEILFKLPEGIGVAGQIADAPGSSKLLLVMLASVACAFATTVWMSELAVHSGR